MKTKLTYGSLFSGVGGFDMGFDQENYECVFQVEWDKHCQNILAKHWPEVPKWSDVQDVNGAEIPPCDVLTFGSPCQDLSVAGKRAGLEGTKSSMFYEATRIIKEMRNATESIYPRVVIWENVPGALSSNNGADFGAVIDTLADIGAVDIQWSVLDAQHFGVPQRRRRIFVVAIFDPATSDRCPDPLLPVIKGSRGDFAKGRKAQQNAARSADVSIETGGQWWDGETTADCLTTTSNEQRMPDKNRLQAVLVPNEIIGALCARDYKGVGNQYVDEGKLVVQDAVVPLKTSNTKANGMNVGEPGDPMYTLDTGNSLAVAYSIREDAKNNNFSATETDIALCLNGLQPSTQSHHAQLFIAEPIVYDGYDQKADFSGTHRTLRVGRDSGDFVAQPVIMLNFQGSKGNSSTNDDDVSFTLNAMHGHDVHVVAQPIIFENSFRDGPRIGDDVCHTLPAKMGSGGGNTPMLAFDPEIIGPLTSSGMSRARGTESVESNHVLAINTPMLAVRRLTPLECERLMGWPDDHTRFYADGTEQADTHRYKQCGNGVATPVAKWIAKHLKNILITNNNE